MILALMTAYHVPSMAKLTGEDHQRFLLEKLEEQRHLLHKSIGEFAAGDLAEAVHIAVAMRVLVHETSSSKPLLKQLTGNYLELKILDRAPVKEKDVLPPGTQRAVVMSVPIGVKITGTGVFLNPRLDVEGYKPSILGKWWTTVIATENPAPQVFCSPHSFNRKTGRYMKQLRAALYARISTSNGQQDPEMQLRELRQFAAARGWPIIEQAQQQVLSLNERRPEVAGFVPSEKDRSSSLLCVSFKHSSVRLKGVEVLPNPDQAFTNV
jgi:hypothetical protein